MWDHLGSLMNWTSQVRLDTICIAQSRWEDTLNQGTPNQRYPIADHETVVPRSNFDYVSEW